MKRVLVIVVTYNGRPWLDRCLGSVTRDPSTSLGMTEEGADPSTSLGEAFRFVISSGAGGGVEKSLFVVDNDSTDGSADYIQAHFPEAKLVRSAENLLFSKANNLGFEYALEHGYDYVYLLNQDAWLEPGALETLVQAAEEHPVYAVLSPLQLTADGTTLDPQFAKLYPAGTKTAQSVPGEAVVEVRRVMAAHWLVPVGALRKVGLFDETLFPLYGQDDDWCNRARYHGMKIGIVPGARGVHDRAQRQEPKEKVIRRNYYTGSLIRLADINRPLCERFLFVCLFTLVKTVKYRSFLPMKLFRQICKEIPAVKRLRKRSRDSSLRSE